MVEQFGRFRMVLVLMGLKNKMKNILNKYKDEEQEHKAFLKNYAKVKKRKKSAVDIAGDFDTMCRTIVNLPNKYPNGKK